jgi:hypothetical protein
LALAGAAATGAAGAAATGAGAASAATVFFATRLGAEALIIPEEEELELILIRGNTYFHAVFKSIFKIFCVFLEKFLGGNPNLIFFFEKSIILIS